MKNYLFKTLNKFDDYINKIVPINDFYNIDNKLNIIVLSKMNVFIGENNSGKSIFLRSLFKEFNLFTFKETGIDRILTSLGSNMRQLYEFEYFSFIHSKLVDMSKYEQIIFMNILEDVSSIIDYEKRFYFPVIRGVKNYKEVINDTLESFKNYLSEITNKDTINHFIYALNFNTYGLESLDIYQDIIFNEYFSSTNDNDLKSRILTGGKLYNEIKSLLLGKEENRKLIKDFQEFLKSNFFSEHENVLLTPIEKEKVLYLKIGSDDRPIYEWGDGIQQLIIILYSLYKRKEEKDFLLKNRNYICIREY